MTINIDAPPKPNRLGRTIEAVILSSLGGWLAWTFIRLLLAAGHDSPAAAFVVGWGFFLWPGVIDTLLWCLHTKPIFTPPVLSFIAAVLGVAVGGMDGVWRIHRWRGIGYVTFLLDVTWGLAGSANGCFLHLLNLLGRARHQDAPRGSAHRYLNGFSVKAGYAITLGSVMGNLPADAEGLLPHELLHVWQNRLFGPFYTLTYLGWMAVMLLPAVAVGSVKGRVVATTEDWCYLNNPWENWAYRYGGWRDPSRVWNTATRSITTIMFFLVAACAAVWIISSISA